MFYINYLQDDLNKIAYYDHHGYIQYNIDKLNWSCNIRDILYRYGFNDVWLSQRVVNTKLFLNEFKQIVIDNYIAEGLFLF
jgi:hypothetical protein